MTKSRARKFADIMGGTFVGLIEDGQIDIVDVDGLSAIQTKVNGIEASADVTDTTNVVAALTAGTNITIAANGTISGSASYTHPTHPGDDFSVDTGALTGATVVSDIDINVTTDSLGHVTDANGSVATRTLTLADLGYTGATNATANVGDITGVTAGSGITGGGTSGTVTVSHSDTSSQASVNNSNGTVIQDITLDAYGHITGIASANLDGLYYTETEADSRFLRSDASDTHTGTLTLDVVNVGNELRLPNNTSLTDVSLTGASDQDTGFNWSGSNAVNYVSGGVLKYNLNNVWHTGNDGSGSGLDADLLDGVQGSSYLRSDASDTFTTLTGTTLTTTNLTIGSSAKINFQNNDSISYNDGDGVGAFSFNADAGTANAKVKAGSFHGDGSSLTGISSGSIGVGQDWRRHTSRVANTWYQNNSSIGIMIQAYTTTGAIVYTGPSTSSFATIRQSDRDSDLDNPSYVIIPAGHYWKVSSVNTANSYQYQHILD